MMRNNLSQKSLKEVLSYDKTTGCLTWLINTGRVNIGTVAGTKGSYGHIIIQIDGIRKIGVENGKGKNTLQEGV